MAPQAPKPIRFPKLSEEDQFLAQQGDPSSPPRLRQVLAQQHPIHEEFNKAYQNLGGVVGLTDWAEDNPTQFYRLFAKMAPQPKEQTFIAINTSLNGEDQAIEATRVEDIDDPNAATAVYQVLMRGG